MYLFFSIKSFEVQLGRDFINNHYKMYDKIVLIIKYLVKWVCGKKSLFYNYSIFILLLHSTLRERIIVHNKMFRYV